MKHLENEQPSVHQLEDRIGPQHQSQTKPEKRQITRTRISHSCQTCRRRKVKCDRQHPTCGGCQKADLDCVYENPASDNLIVDSTLAYRSGVKRKTNSTSPARSSGADLDSETAQSYRLQAVEQQLARLTSLLHEIRGDGASVPAHEQPQTPASYTSQQIAEETQRNTSSHTNSPTSQANVTSTEFTQQRSPSDQPKGSQLPADATYARHFQEAIWSLLSDEVDQLHTLTRGFGGFAVTSQTNSKPCGEHRSPEETASDQKTLRSSEPYSFHRISYGRQVSESHSNCEKCSRRLYDKSVLLQDAWTIGTSGTAPLDYASVQHNEQKGNVLFRSWLSGIYLAYPIIPPRLAVEKHTAFWKWKQLHDAGQLASTTRPDINSLCVLNAIWYTGALSLSSKALQHWFPNVSRAKLCAHFHDQTVRHLVDISFPSHVNLSALGSFLLLQLLPSMEEEPLQSSTYTNLIIRSAQIIGLHREPATQTSSVWDSEMRRRLWWQVVQLDTSLVVSSGHPPFLQDCLSDTKMMSEVKDCLVGSKEALKYQHDLTSNGRKPDLTDEPFSNKNTSMVSVSLLFAQSSSIAALALRKVLQTLLTTRYITREDLNNMHQRIAEVEVQLKSAIDSIRTKGLPEFGFVPDHPSGPGSVEFDNGSYLGESLATAEIDLYAGLSTDGLSSSLMQYHRQKITAFHKWARIVLSMTIDRLHCVAYAPFLRNAKSSFWITSRQCGLHHCHSFMRKLLSLVSDPSLEPFRWSWPGIHQPMHAAMVILVDVYERPDSVEAARSRELIDELFRLADPSNGIVGGGNGVSVQRPLREGGVEAWEMLLGLRAAAWRKAGLDPEALWTVEEQVAVGVARPLTEEQKIAQDLREDFMSETNKTNETPNSQHSDLVVSGMHHVLNMVRKDIDSSTNPPTYPADGSKKKLKFEFGQPSLAKLKGQNRMPFPLHGKAMKCPNDTRNTQQHHEYKENGQDDASTRSALDMGAELISNRENDRNGKDDRDESCVTGTQLIKDSNCLHVNSSGGSNGNVLHADGEAGVSQNNNLNMNGSAALPTGPKEDLNPNGENCEGQVNDYSLNGNQQAEEDLGFDWERWDSVFGQYSAFADLMDGVTWDG